MSHGDAAGRQAAYRGAYTANELAIYAAGFERGLVEGRRRWRAVAWLMVGLVWLLGILLAVEWT